MSAPKTQALEALIEAHATELKLPTVKRRFRQLAAEALREQQTPIAYLAALLEAEHQERAERREKRRLIDARFPIIKRLEEFRFDDNPKVPQATIAASPTAPGSTIARASSSTANPASGKTMLATGLARLRVPPRPPRAVHHPRRAWRTSSKKLTADASSAGSSAATPAPSSWCSTSSDTSRLPDGAAELVFQVISERNERGSLIVTTNLPFGKAHRFR